MNFNVDELLQHVQDLRSQLEVMGITSQGLWIVGGIAALLFIFSLREVLTWFFRVNQVRDEVRELRAQLITMNRAILETRDMLINPGNVPVPPMKADELVKIAQGMRDAPKFRLDH
jgi:hypothetical protein